MGVDGVEAKLDTRQFDAAFREYYETTGKDLAYCANRQALNVAIKTGMRTPLGSASKIRKLVERDWWPKYVAKRIYSEKGVRIKDGKTKGGKQKYRKVKGSHAAGRERRYTVADARKVSRTLIQARVSRVGFIRSGWLPAIRALTALKIKALSAAMQASTSARLAGTGKIQKPKGDVKVASPGLNPVAVIINNSQGAEKVGARALQEGLDAAAADMREFIRDKFGDTAKRFNAK